MKKYGIVFSLCCITALNGMDLKSFTDCRLKLSLFKESAQSFLNSYAEVNRDFTIANKTILHIDCQTGDVSELLATQAASVHGLDELSEMIVSANLIYADNKNLSFEVGSIQNYKSQQPYKMVTAFNYLPSITNKQTTIQKIAACLEMGGEFFGNTITSSNELWSDIKTFRKLFPELKKNNPALQNIELEHIILPYPSDEMYREIFTLAGFEILYFETVSQKTFLKTKHDVFILEFYRFATTELIKFLKKPEQIGDIFKDFMHRLLPTLEQTKEGYYIYHIPTTLIHARKNQNTIAENGNGTHDNTEQLTHF